VTRPVGLSILVKSERQLAMLIMIIRDLFVLVVAGSLVAERADRTQLQLANLTFVFIGL